MTTRRSLFISLVAALVAVVQAGSAAQPRRWSEQAAQQWYRRQPWIVGSNFIPASAVNELEMWQPDTFDPNEIDKELGWAENLGMNSMRVFLHDLLWDQDPDGFKKRIDIFLTIANKHHIRPLFVLFDSCWDPFPHLGRQPAPRPGVHNSRWVQSPGAKALEDPPQYPRLEAYVKGVVGAFANDPRILGWDIWNEPDNPNSSSYGKEEPSNKVQLVLALLPQTFAWARSTNPSQPLTSGVWQGDWSSPATLPPMAKEQLELSDVTSFHSYDPPGEFAKRVKWLQAYHRPILCTEYMARPKGSTFAGILPVARKYDVAAYNWGFVAGKTQTYLPWDSWRHPYIRHAPAVWFHDIFKADGTAYKPDEVKFIEQIAAKDKTPTR